MEGKRKLFHRLFIYGLGIVILALGITLNTKTGLGVSALVSIAYSSGCMESEFCIDDIFAVHLLCLD